MMPTNELKGELSNLRYELRETQKEVATMKYVLSVLMAQFSEGLQSDQLLHMLLFREDGERLFSRVSES